MKWLIFLFFSLSSPFISSAQHHYDAEQIPFALRSRANAVVRNEEVVVTMNAHDNVYYTVKQAITVFNKNGERNANLVLFYDKSTVIKSIKGEIYTGNGLLYGKFGARDFTDESAVNDFSLYEDNRVKYYSPRINSYPYTVVYQYEVLFKQNLIIPAWYPRPADDISVEKSSYTFICKPNDKLRIKVQHLPLKVEQSVTEKLKTLTWKATNLPAIKTEPFSPNPETYQTFVKIAPEDFSYYNHESSYKDWHELGKWIYDGLLKDRTALLPSTIQSIKDLVKSEKTDKDKARKIYQYFQDKTRYISVQIGIGGFKPFSAADVDRLGYGDCKALVNYMQSLLKAVNIESYYCIVKAGDEKRSLDPTFASMNQANHVILAIPFAGDTTWLECTSQKIPFGFLSNFTDDRLVLACTPTGGKLLHTPKYTTSDNLQKRTANFFLDKEGNINGDVTTLFKGTQYDNNEHIAGKVASEQQKLLKEAYPIDNVNFAVVTYTENIGQLPELEEKLTLTIRNHGAVNANKIFLPLNPIPLKITVQEVRNRTLPVYINRGYTNEDSITYTLANEIVASIEPVEKSYRNKFGSYVFKTSVKENVITHYRKFVLNEGTYDAASYSDFVKFIDEVNTNDKIRSVLMLK